MHRFPKILKLGAAILAGSTLLGCQMGSLVPTGLPKAPTTPSTLESSAGALDSALPAEADLPQVELIPQPSADQAQGAVSIAIKWPERPRSIQAIPLSANSMRIRITPAAGGEDLYNDLIGRSDSLASPDPYNPQAPQPMVRKYILKKDVAYQIAVSVYKEQPQAVTESSTAIAFTETPAEVTLSANETQAVKLVLKALYTPTLAEAAYGAGGGATLTVAGSGFGTSASQIRAEWVQNQWNKVNLEVVEVTDTAVKLRMPENNNGYGTLNLYRDGVKANAAGTTLAVVSNLEMPSENVLPLKRSDQNFDTFYALEDQSFLLTLNRADGRTFDHLVQTVKVKNNETQQDVTGSVFANGQFTLPKGSYTVTFTSGTATKAITLEAGTVTWAADPSPFVVTPYYVTDYLTANHLPLAGYYLLTKGGQSVPFKKSDFTWTFDPPGVVVQDPDYQWEENSFRFKATATPGAATIRGTLRYDPNRVIQAAVTNAKISAFNLQQASDVNAYEPTWSNLAEPTTIAIPRNQQVRIRVRSVKLTTNTTKIVSGDWTFRDRLEWTSLLQGTQDPGDDVASVEVSQTNNSQTEAVITAVQEGTVTVRLIHEGDPTQERLLTVNVTPEVTP